MGNGMGYFTIFELLIGVYLLWCAVTGKGKLYENDNLKIPREQYVKVMRVMSAVTGGVLVLTNGLIALGAIQEGSAVGWIAWAVGFGCILAMAVYSAKATRRPSERPVQQGSGPVKDPLRAAFVFDDEDEQSGNDRDS